MLSLFSLRNFPNVWYSFTEYSAYEYMTIQSIPESRIMERFDYDSYFSISKIVPESQARWLNKNTPVSESWHCYNTVVFSKRTESSNSLIGRWKRYCKQITWFLQNCIFFLKHMWIADTSRILFSPYSSTTVGIASVVMTRYISGLSSMMQSATSMALEMLASIPWSISVPMLI